MHTYDYAYVMGMGGKYSLTQVKCENSIFLHINDTLQRIRNLLEKY